MSRSKKIFLWAVGSLAFFVVLVVGFALVVPYLIKLEPIKEKILAALSKQLGGKVEFQKLELSYFPHPCVKIRQVSLSIPEKAAGTLKSVKAYPELLAILRGEVRVSTIEVESPDLIIRLPKEREKTTQKPKGSLLEEIGEVIAQVSAVASTNFPNLKGVVKDGSLNVYEESQLVLSFRNLEGRILFSRDNMKMDVSCRSNLWEKMSVQAAVNPVNFKGQGQIDLVNFYPHVLTDSLVPIAPLRIEDSRMDLQVRFNTEGPKTLQAEVDATIPLIAFRQGKKVVVIRGKDLKGRAQVDEERMEVSLDEFALDHPQLTLSGKVRMDSKAPWVVLEVEGREVDVGSTREVALAMAGEVPTVQEIFDYVRGGRIPLITLRSQGRSIEDLGKTGNLAIKGRIEGAEVFIRPAELKLENVMGDVVISGGILQGMNLEASIGNSRGRGGTVKLGLEGENAPFHLEMMLDADLTQGRWILDRVVTDEASRKELSLIDILKGSAKGRLILGETLESMIARIDVSELSMSAKYRRIPYPLEITTGQVRYEGESISLKNLAGKFGTSSFSGVTAQFEFGKVPRLEAVSGRVFIYLDEVYPWLASLQPLRESLKGIEAVKGTLGLTVQNLEGPLQEPKHWRFETAGNVKDLTVITSFFPGPIHVGTGAFTASPDKLSFTDVQTSFLDATFKVSGSLTGYGKDPFHLEILTQADLAKLAAILKRVLKDEEFKKELARIEDLKGSAKGKLVLEKKQESLITKLQASDIHLSTRYAPLPYPLEIEGGDFSYEEGKVAVNNLNGKMGESTFSELTAQLGLGKEPYLEVLSGKLAIFLDEIYPWISSQEFLRGVQKNVKSAGGTIRLSEVHLKGPLSNPKNWYFQTAGDVKNMVVNSAFVPGPITVASGKFGVDPEKLFLSNLETNVLDASLGVSGTLYGYSKGLEKAEMDFSGRVTPKDMEWLLDLLHLKGRIRVRAPLSISGAHLSWHKGSHTSFKGDLAARDGPQISLDILQSPNQLKVNQLLIRDEISHAVIGLNLQSRAVGFSFSGSLSEGTLDQIFSGYPLNDGWIKGDFKAHIVMDQPMRSMAEGKLEVHGLSVPWQFEKPLKIDDIVVNASGNHISVAPGTFGWGDKHFALSGDVNFSAEKLLFTVDLSTESLDLDEVRKTLTKEKEGKRTQDVSDPRVEGHIRFKTKSLTYERFTWAPFQAEISFIPDRVRVDVTKANLCGISTPGTVIVTSQGLSLNFQPVSKNQDLTSTILCLLAERVRMTGDFDLMGSIQGQGESEKLAQLLRGNVELGAQKGRIYRLNLLSKIFSFVNVTGIVAGRLPDFRDKGLAYDSVKVKVDLQNGKIVVKEGTLQGPTVGIASSGEIDPKAQKIDFTVLVAPFRTVDYVISKIPLVNHILGGTLISIPVKVTGDLEDPRVRPLSPSAVESDLLGIMERTLGLPFRLIHLFLPKKEEEQGGP